VNLPCASSGHSERHPHIVASLCCASGALSSSSSGDASSFQISRAEAFHGLSG